MFQALSPDATDASKAHPPIQKHLTDKLGFRGREGKRKGAGGERTSHPTGDSRGLVIKSWGNWGAVLGSLSWM